MSIKYAGSICRKCGGQTGAQVVSISDYQYSYRCTCGENHETKTLGSILRDALKSKDK